LLAPPVFAGNMAVSVCKDNRKSLSIKGHQTISLQHTHNTPLSSVLLQNVYLCI
jgi:hypothetical protein